MKLQVLVSVMNITDWRAQRELMRITSGLVMVNQLTDESIYPFEYSEDDVAITSLHERGLSKSRNRAVRMSTADICLIADGDVTYEDGYEQTITEAFEKHANVDVILFCIERVDGAMMRVRPGKVGLLHSMKANSKLIAFRRESIVNNEIVFDERFGAGSNLYMGEENILLNDCRRKGLKIVSHPVKIARLRPHTSTWSRERNEQYFYIKGRMFCRISPPLAYILSVQFATRKSGKRNKSISLFRALKAALRGVRDEAGGKPADIAKANH